MKRSRLLTERQKYHIAHAAGSDAGDRSMRAHRRRKWSKQDFSAAARTFERVYRRLAGARAGSWRRNATMVRGTVSSVNAISPATPYWMR